MFQPLTAVCEFGRRESKWSSLLLAEPWERKPVKVQCDVTVVATKKRFLSVVLPVVKLVTAMQRT